MSYLELARKALAVAAPGDTPEPAPGCEESEESEESLPPWNQAAAEALLAGLRAEVERIKAGFGGRLPEPLANVLADALAIAEGYAVNYEAEAARGWDALELLRGMVPCVRRCAARAGWAARG